jgi:hypothetical protein
MVLKSLLSLLALSATTALVSANNTPVATLTLDFNEIAFGTRKLSKELQFNREQAAHGLFESLCKGFGNGTSRVLTLTTDRKVQYHNRELSGCTKNPCDRNAFNTACVQFPFVSTVEAGTEHPFTCVPPLSQFFQGAILSSFRTHTNLRDGQKFEVDIVNFNCASLTPLSSHQRRASNPETLQKGRLETFPPFTSNDVGLSTGIVPLPQILDAGSYSVQTVDLLGTPASRNRLVSRAPTPNTGPLSSSNPGRVSDDGGNLYPTSSGNARRHNNDQRSFTINFDAPRRICKEGMALFLSGNAATFDVDTKFFRRH